MMTYMNPFNSEMDFETLYTELALDTTTHVSDVFLVNAIEAMTKSGEIFVDHFDGTQKRFSLIYQRKAIFPRTHFLMKFSNTTYSIFLKTEGGQIHNISLSLNKKGANSVEEITKQIRATIALFNIIEGYPV